MRRPLFTLLAAAAAMLLLPTSAGADAVVSFHSPAPDALVGEATPLVVDVQRRLIDPRPEQVTLRLGTDAAEPLVGVPPVDLECIEGCDGASQTTSRWAGPELDPATLAPFADAPVCNGRWWLLADVAPGPSERAGESHGSFLVSERGSAVTDLSVRVEVRDVVLSWVPAPEADVRGYRVERRSTGAWQPVAELTASASSFRHGPVADGRYDYRVVTLRPDGFVDGEPSAACADNGADLTTPSATWKVEMSSTSGGAAPADGQPASGSDDDAAATPDGAQPDSEDANARDGDDESTDGPARSGSGSARQRLAAAGDGDSLSAPGVDAGADPRGSEDRERYFGEDGPFDDRLDYAGVDGVAADDPAYATERVPGGIIEVFDRELDLAHILPPVATGLVLIAIGLHLRRWVRT